MRDQLAATVDHNTTAGSLEHLLVRAGHGDQGACVLERLRAEDGMEVPGARQSSGA